MKKNAARKKQTGIRKLINGKYRIPAVMISIFAVGILLVVGGFYTAAWVQHYKRIADQSKAEPMRELVINAIRGLGESAPVDPKTGDVYFPKAKLYLPVSAVPSGESYRYSWDENNKVLVVISEDIRERHAMQLVSSPTLEDMFNKIPKLQACSRGVAVSYTQETGGLVMDQPQRKQSFMIDNKTAYAFIDTACSENGATAEAMAALKSY